MWALVSSRTRGLSDSARLTVETSTSARRASSAIVTFFTPPPPCREARRAKGTAGLLFVPVLPQKR